MKRRFQKGTKFDLPQLCQKLILVPKMTKNGCPLSMVVSYTIRKPMERRFQTVHKKFDLHHPLSALPKNQQYLLASCLGNTED